MNFLNTSYQDQSKQWDDVWFEALLEQTESNENLPVELPQSPSFQDIFAQPSTTGERGFELLEFAHTNPEQPSYRDIFQTAIPSQNQRNFSDKLIVIDGDVPFSFTGNTTSSSSDNISSFGSDSSLNTDQSVSEKKQKRKNSKAQASLEEKEEEKEIRKEKNRKKSKAEASLSLEEDKSKDVEGLSLEEKKDIRKQKNRQFAKISRERKKEEKKKLHEQTHQFLEMGQKIEQYVHEYRLEFPTIPLHIEKPAIRIDLKKADGEEKSAAFSSYLERVENIIYNFATGLTTQHLASELDKERILQLEMENAQLKAALLTANSQRVDHPSSTGSNSQ